MNTTRELLTLWAQVRVRYVCELAGPDSAPKARDAAYAACVVGEPAQRRGASLPRLTRAAVKLRGALRAPPLLYACHFPSQRWRLGVRS